MADDTAPPREAVEAVTFIHGRPLIGLPFPGAEADAKARLANLRTLPDPALWRLIAWLAQGREPTREMVERTLQDEDEWRFMPPPEARVKRTFRIILAAAKGPSDDAE